MGIVVGFVVFFIALSAAANFIEQGAKSKVLRPYVGLLLIAALTAGLGLILGFLFSGLRDFLLVTAKIIAVLACSGLFLHLIFMVARRWL